MRTLTDPQGVLVTGLAAIRARFGLPERFPPEVEAAAAAAAARTLDAHVDRTTTPFVTLDPAGSRDLDQAFSVEPAGADLLLRYAIADVGWFVRDGDPVDAEAWRRGETIYLPDGRVPLHPPVLSEGAASLLPDGDRPAVVFAVRVSPDGAAQLDGAERALIRSRAKLAYETVGDADLPPSFPELVRRIAAAEARRGAARVDPPEQEVTLGNDGRYALAFAPRLASEDANAALSLATNLAVAQALIAHRTGLFRVMPEPDAHAVARLRHTAAALHCTWPEDVPLAELERTLDPADARQSALMLAIRRAGHGASYAPFRDNETPWHSAVAAPYAHATAPLRRLADRYVIEAALAVANGAAVPDSATAAFARLAPVMARAEATAGAIDRAVIDLAEAALLAGREGETFDAVVTEADDRTARIQLRDPAVVARLAAPGLAPGAHVAVRLVDADAGAGTVAFAPA